MSKIIVYHKPTCTTSRKVIKILTDKGIPFNKVDYYQTPFTKSKLKILLNQMKMSPVELLRKKDKAYKELNLKNKKYSDTQLINMMIENPNLIERPIVEKGTKVILARPPERVLKFESTAS